MKKMVLATLTAATLLLVSCDQVASIINDGAITNEESVEALRSALTIGIESGTSDIKEFKYAEYSFAKADPAGSNSRDFQKFRDSLILKILLPDSVQTVIKTIKGNPALSLGFSQVMGIDALSMEKDLISRFNSAADAAAPKSIAIFKSAIKDSMTVTDGMKIITTKDNSGKQDSIAATNYLNKTTHSSLVTQYSAIMNTALADVQAVTAWQNFASSYNTKLMTKFNSTPVTALLVKDFPQSLPTDLSSYATGKALDGLFVVVGYEEIKIRRNPSQYLSPIIKKVFGSLK